MKRIALAGVLATFTASCGEWVGPDGQAAPELVINEYDGGDCGNPSMTYLDFRSTTYARDIDGVLDPQRDTAGPFLADARLPEDARDTGYESSGRHLFISPSEGKKAVYLVEGDQVERWPKYLTQTFCA